MLNEKPILYEMVKDIEPKHGNVSESINILLNNAIVLLPGLDAVKLTAAGMKIVNSSPAEIDNDTIGSVFFSIDKFIGIMNFNNIQAKWDALDDESVLKGFKALSLLNNFSKNCPNIENAYSEIERYLLIRYNEKVDTIDQKLMNEEILFINQHEKIYVLYNMATGVIPCVFHSGGLVFTKREYAESVVKENQDDNLCIKEFSLELFTAHLKTWKKYGINHFRLNFGQEGHQLDISVDLFTGDNKQYLSTNVFLLSAWLTQRRNSKNPDQTMIHVIGNAVYSAIHSALFLVPIGYEDDKPNTPVDDYILHTTKQASERLLKMQFEKQLGMSLENYIVELEAQGKGAESLKGQTVTFNNTGEIPFYGGEKYSFATATDGSTIQYGKTMHITAVINNGHTFIPLFTDFQELHAVYGEHVRVGLFTYEDVLKRLNDNVVNNGTVSQIEGIVVNPASKVILQFSKADIEHNENMRLQAQQNNAVPSPTQKQQIANQFENTVKPQNKKLKYCKTSIILGTLAFLFDITPIMGILAVIFGILGMPKEKNAEGRGRAIAGIVTGSINILFGILCILVFVFGN